MLDSGKLRESKQQNTQQTFFSVMQITWEESLEFKQLNFSTREAYIQLSM